MVTSGVRLGTPAGTTRGFGVAEFEQVGDMIARVLDSLASTDALAIQRVEAAVKAEVEALCAKFPIYR